LSDITKSIERLAQGASVLFVGTIFGRGFALIGELFIARSLPPGRYGSLVLAYTITTIAGQIALFGIHNGVTRLISASPNGIEITNFFVRDI
jgi:O-antigen/teichoic acid export membrane protein